MERCAISISNGSDYAKDNDLFSTARGASLEFTDYYLLNRKPEPVNNRYPLMLKELDQEQSYSDLLHLMVIDHAPDVNLANDENGHIYTYKDPLEAVTVTTKNGAVVTPLLKTMDGIGYHCYHNDYIDLDFGSLGNTDPPIFVLKAQGYLFDTAMGSLIQGVTPSIEIQTQQNGGLWVTRNIFHPRNQPAVCAYDLNNCFPLNKLVRLKALSCHTGKYHSIDFAGISTEPAKPVVVTDLSPLVARRSDGVNVATPLSAADGVYAHMSEGEEIAIDYAIPPQAENTRRDFIVKSKGYYVPSGTFYFYTWDGSKWAQRDGWSILYNGDQQRTFDLSLWLPDPNGEYKVRIWQDYFYDPAGVDYVGLMHDSTQATMLYAKDLRMGDSVLEKLNVSDNVKLEWGFGVGRWDRGRWLELGWTDTFVNTPPSTYPVFVTNTASPTPTINWTYHDIDNDPQASYETEVWAGPDGTGSNMWDPAPESGAANNRKYSGKALTNGVKYYARVKAFDSISWGGWSETSFTIGSNAPPIAEAGRDTTLIIGADCRLSYQLDGSASYDPDGDTLTFLWTGPFGVMTGARPVVYFSAGRIVAYLEANDGKGGVGKDSVVVTVKDTTKPVPDRSTLADTSAECALTLTTPPTATDNCARQTVATTDDSLEYTTQGTHTVVWKFDDGFGNIVTQTQKVIITDVTPPVPDMPALPLLSGECKVEVTNIPTATDNCANKIAGTTNDSLIYSRKGTYTITWNYNDNNGNVSTQRQTVMVTDNTAPLPDVFQLPNLVGACLVSIIEYPTATDNCSGKIIGATDDPLRYSLPGTYTVHWKYDDGNGNVSQQTQKVMISKKCTW